MRKWPVSGQVCLPSHWPAVWYPSRSHDGYSFRNVPDLRFEQVKRRKELGGTFKLFSIP